MSSIETLNSDAFEVGVSMSISEISYQTLTTGDTLKSK